MEKIENSWHNVRGASIDELRDGEKKAMEKYGDIIGLPHHESQRHAKLSMEMRAAQFSPFAALTGFEDAIEETARQTDTRPELEEDKREELDKKLAPVFLGKRKEIYLTWFEEDGGKKGGKIKSGSVVVKRVNTVEGALILEDGRKILFCDVLDIA